MFENSRTLLNSLKVKIGLLNGIDADYIKSIFADYILIKIAHELQPQIRKLAQEYIQIKRNIAINLSDKDKNQYCRNWNSFDIVFKGVIEDIKVNSVKIIMTARHEIAHSSVVSSKVIFDDIEQHMNNAEDFINDFKNIISDEENKISELNLK